jgi:hypothetical protein
MFLESACVKQHLHRKRGACSALPVAACVKMNTSSMVRRLGRDELGVDWRCCDGPSLDAALPCNSLQGTRVGGSAKAFTQARPSRRSSVVRAFRKSPGSGDPTLAAPLRLSQWCSPY